MFGKIRALFEVSITFDHSPKSDETSGASGSDIGQNIAADFDRHIFLFIYIWLAAVLALLIGLLVLHSIYFHVNYLDSNHYRNYYLTKEFFDINKEKPTGLTENLLPLRPTERKTFVGVIGFQLVSIEYFPQFPFAAGLVAPLAQRDASCECFHSASAHY